MAMGICVGRECLLWGPSAGCMKEKQPVMKVRLEWRFELTSPCRSQDVHTVCSYSYANNHQQPTQVSSTLMPQSHGDISLAGYFAMENVTWKAGIRTVWGHPMILNYVEQWQWETASKTTQPVITSIRLFDAHSQIQQIQFSLPLHLSVCLFEVLVLLFRHVGTRSEVMTSATTMWKKVTVTPYRCAPSHKKVLAVPDEFLPWRRMIHKSTTRERKWLPPYSWDKQEFRNVGYNIMIETAKT